MRDNLDLVFAAFLMLILGIHMYLKSTRHWPLVKEAQSVNQSKDN